MNTVEIYQGRIDYLENNKICNDKTYLPTKKMGIFEGRFMSFYSFKNSPKIINFDESIKNICLVIENNMPKKIYKSEIHLLNVKDYVKIKPKVFRKIEITNIFAHDKKAIKLLGKNTKRLILTRAGIKSI